MLSKEGESRHERIHHFLRTPSLVDNLSRVRGRLGADHQLDGRVLDSCTVCKGRCSCHAPEITLLIHLQTQDHATTALYDLPLTTSLFLFPRSMSDLNVPFNKHGLKDSEIASLRKGVVIYACIRFFCDH